MDKSLEFEQLKNEMKRADVESKQSQEVRSIDLFSCANLQLCNNMLLLYWDA